MIVINGIKSAWNSATNTVSTAWANLGKTKPKEELKTSIDSLPAIEACWQADSYWQGANPKRWVGLSNVNTIPKAEMEKTITNLERISTVWKRIQVGLMLLVAAALTLAGFSIVPMTTASVIFPIVALVISYDASRAISAMGKIYTTIDAFCKAKRAAGLASYGATTSEQRQAWSAQFKQAKAELDSMLTSRFFGWGAPVAADKKPTPEKQKV